MTVTDLWSSRGESTTY